PVGTVHGGTPFAAVPVWPKPGIHGRADGPLHRSARGAAGDGGGPRWLAERVDRHRRASSSPRSWLARASRPDPRPPLPSDSSGLPMRAEQVTRVPRPPSHHVMITG